MGISVTEPNKPISLLGGLTSFGGAGNNYSGNVSPNDIPNLFYLSIVMF